MGFTDIPLERIVQVARKNGLRNRGKDKSKDFRAAEERIQDRMDEPPILDIERIIETDVWR